MPTPHLHTDTFLLSTEYHIHATTFSMPITTRLDLSKKAFFEAECLDSHITS